MEDNDPGHKYEHKPLRQVGVRMIVLGGAAISRFFAVNGQGYLVESMWRTLCVGKP